MKQTVYVIDDDEQSVSLLSEYVELLGCQAVGYVDAMAFFEEPEPLDSSAVMILDLSMPDMDGIEVMQKMVDTGRLLPFILMSGYDAGVLSSAHKLAKGYSLDIIATLSKPFSLELLRSKLEPYLSV